MAQLVENQIKRPQFILLSEGVMDSEFQEGREVTVTGVGDLLINRHVSMYETDERFMALVKVMKDADVCYANLETVINDNEFPALTKGGGWYGCVGSWICDELKWMGINMVGCANNHALDYSVEGLLNTKKVLNEAGMVNAGTGRDLGEARAPAYLDTEKGRVALLDGTSTIRTPEMAMYARPDIRGSPGMNGIRYGTKYVVDQESAEKLREIASKWNIAIEKDSKEFSLFDQRFSVGDPKVERIIRENDLSTILRAVKDAKSQADWVIFGMHCHEAPTYGMYRPEVPILRNGKDPDYEHNQQPAEFHIELTHALIDAGVDIFFGAGSHCLRGIEIYKGKPIFYSLGNFIYNTGTQPRQPADAYETYKYGRTYYSGSKYPDLDTMWSTPSELSNCRDDDRAKSKSQPATHLWWTTVLPSITMTEGKITDLKLYPVTLQKDKPQSQRGRPILAEGREAEEIIERIKRLSEPFGTEIEYRNGIGMINCTHI